MMDDKTKRLVNRALAAMEATAMTYGAELTEPKHVADYLQLKLGGLDYECFSIVTLTAQYAVISYHEMFRGTLAQTSVHPREILKTCLADGAAAVILAHNHPSGKLDPSEADKYLTRLLETALQYVDVHVLDHFIVTARGHLSFAERGLI